MKIDIDYVEACEKLYKEARAYYESSKTEFICLLCGGVFAKNPIAHPKRCPECKKAAINAQVGRSSLKVKEKAKELPPPWSPGVNPFFIPPKSMKGIAEIEKEALSRHLTYGQLQALRYMAETAK